MNEDILNPENAYNYALKRRPKSSIKTSFVSSPPRCLTEARAAAEALREVDEEIAARRRQMEARELLERL